jgi:hypothetical protein
MALLSAIHELLIIGLWVLVLAAMSTVTFLLLMLPLPNFDRHEPKER